MKTNNKMNYSILVFLGFLISVTGCKPYDTNVLVPVLTTTEVSNLTENSATSGGSIVSDGGGGITARGVCWSLKENPSIADFKTSDGNGIGSFISNITGISSTTVYFVRAYATNSAGTGYGNIVPTIIVDKSGNVYTSIKIGTQTWLKENLKTTRYRTNEIISNFTEAIDWSTSTFGACCDYNNDITNTSKYGKLYKIGRAHV